MRFNHLESEVEMSATRTVFRDSKGYLWIGNLGLGLMRYDGYETIRYRHDKDAPRSISGNFITHILEDDQNQLWVATRNGLNRYDPETDSFQRIPPKDSDGSGSVVFLYQDSQKRLWAVSPDALHLYENDQESFKTFRPAQTQANGNSFTSIVQDERNRLWLSDSGQRLWEFEPNSESFAPHTLFPQSKGTTKKLYRDLTNHLWVAARDDGLFRFYPDELRVERYLLDPNATDSSQENICDIIEYPEGQLLIANDQGGLSLFDKETKRFSHQRLIDGTGNGLSTDGIISFHKDHEDILWVGTSRNGVDFHNPQMERFTTYRQNDSSPIPSLAHNTIGSLYEDHKGRIWIGTDGGGISILDPDTGTFRNLKHDSNDPSSIRSNTIRKIDQDTQGRIWVSTWNGGVDALVENENRFSIDQDVAAKLSDLDFVSIWDIKVDRKDRLWVATAKGEVRLYDSEQTLIATFDQALKSGIVSHSPIVSELSTGLILLITEIGIFRFDEEQRVMVPFIDIEKPSVITYSNQKSTFYVGTVDQGLFAFNSQGEITHRYGTDQGLPDLFIRSLEIVNSDEIWVGTSAGLCRLNNATEEATTFLETDGLQGNLYFINSSLKTKDSTFYFGGTNGLSSFRPEEIQPNQNVPSVYLNKVSLFGKEIDFKEPQSPIDKHPQSLENLRFDWNQNFVIFEYGATNLTFPTKTRYAYKLDGFDQDWTYGDFTLRAAHYTNIDPGEYVFRVKAANSDGAWNQDGLSIQLTITPPFWQRSWFYFLVFTSTCAFIYTYIIYRERRLKTDKEELQSRVEERTKVVNDQKQALAEKTEKLAEQKATLEEHKTELEAQRDQLQTHRDHLEEMIAVRTKELVDAKDRAEGSDRLKSQFLANLSHEVRTPLNAITGFASFIEDEELDSQTRSEYVKIIGDNSNELLSLIENILDYSLINAKELNLFPNEYSLNPFLQKLFDSNQTNAQSSEVKFRIVNQLQDENLTLFYDEVRVAQILSQLLSNSFKFTQDGFIELGVRRDGDSIQFYVMDSGHGIPQDQLEQVFHNFVKLEEDDKAARRGVGLGLSIAKQLAALMGGNLSLESKYGTGSLFTLNLPFSEKESRPADKATNNSPNSSIAKPPSSRKRKVLVIEDEPANFNYLDVALQRMGWEVLWAQDGVEGIKTLEQQDDFDLILLDIKMPRMDGFQAIEHIRKINPSIKVIAQTAFATKNDEINIRNAGFDDYLSKPIEPSRLKQVMNQWAE